MAFFEVTSRELRNKAENLRGLNGQFRAKCNELDSQEQELCSMWDEVKVFILSHLLLLIETRMNI